MKRFLIVLCVVLLLVGILAACAPIGKISNDVEKIGADVENYTKALPDWVIIAGAVILFFIGFGFIWKLIPGFIKFIALIVLAAAIAGAAYGIWKIPAYDTAKDVYENIKGPVQTYLEQDK